MHHFLSLSPGHINHSIFSFLVELIVDTTGGIENPFILIAMTLAPAILEYGKLCLSMDFGCYLLMGEIGDNESGPNPKGMYWYDDNIGDIDQA
ncbi:hypothetical protein [Pedobacter sp. MC2016-24]|uniref:hypothetical protein n=1 Tax=Pedobacter sp. MC2016-24 TaxID=2780090 RepID=UPI001881289F|nr:hypothetical protein [Pedobacter sp. MC2016-24]MBE9597979.1 hypothetical protein [Pedobacter sp. MC2016-24]